jgi:hypothetical protein
MVIYLGPKNLRKKAIEFYQYNGSVKNLISAKETKRWHLASSMTNHDMAVT